MWPRSLQGLGSSKAQQRPLHHSELARFARLIKVPKSKSKSKKSLADALEIRDALAKERAELGARGNTARNGRAGAIRIERREVVIFFD